MFIYFFIYPKFDIFNLDCLVQISKLHSFLFKFMCFSIVTILIKCSHNRNYVNFLLCVVPVLAIFVYTIFRRSYYFSLKIALFHLMSQSQQSIVSTAVGVCNLSFLFKILENIHHLNVM